MCIYDTKQNDVAMSLIYYVLVPNIKSLKLYIDLNINIYIV